MSRPMRMIGRARSMRLGERQALPAVNDHEAVIASDCLHLGWVVHGNQRGLVVNPHARTIARYACTGNPMMGGARSV